MDIIRKKATSGGGGSIYGGIITTKNTINATPTTIDTVAIPTDEAFLIKARVSAKKDDITEKGGFEKQAMFANNSGAISKQGGTTSMFHQAQAGWDVTFLISGTDVLIQVTGALATNVSWSCNRQTVEI